MAATEQRRHDIDWLRVIAIGLLLVYHMAIVFQPWGVFIGFLQNDSSLEKLWVPMAMLNVWRIPLLFFVSGMGVSLAMRKRNLGQLVLERTRRILIPFIFGMFCIVPLHAFIWQKYYSQDISYTIHPGHLWFLGNIFIYVLLLSPLLYLIRKHEYSRLNQLLRKLFASPVGVLIVSAAFIIETMLVRPEIYTLYAMTLHGFLMGLLAFLFGFICNHTGNVFWDHVRQWRWIYLALALILYMVRLFAYNLSSPLSIAPLETVVWIFCMFGIASAYLNRSGRALSYLSQAAYPVYILHMFFLYLGAYLILPLEIPAILKFLLLNVFTAAGCFGLYEIIIRRSRLLRPLFGLKRPVRERELTYRYTADQLTFE